MKLAKKLPATLRNVVCELNTPVITLASGLHLIADMFL